MDIVALDQQMPTLLTLIGLCLGILGSLYLAYDLSGRSSKILHRCVWFCSSGFLYGFVVLASGLSLIISQHLSGVLLIQAWRLMAIVILIGLFMQFLSSRPAQILRPSGVDWRLLLFSMVWSAVGLVGIGEVLVPPGSSPVVAVIFALPGLLVIGLLNGFSPAILWWMLHLPQKRIAVVGALLICCAFILVVMFYVLGILGISIQ